MSIDCMFLPSRMIEPLPKLRSICKSAASRAFDLSMDDPSTRRSAALAALIGRAPYGRDSTSSQRTADNAVPCLPAPAAVPCCGSVPLLAPDNGEGSNVHDLFYVRNMFFCLGGGCCPNSMPLRTLRFST